MTKVSDAATAFGCTLKSLVKIALQSRPSSVIKRDRENRDRTLYILANGPSLRQTLDTYGHDLAGCDTMAVNFAANAPEFRVIRPRYYVLADPHFFRATKDPNVRMLLDNIAAATWDLTLLIDRRYGRLLRQAVSLPDNVRVKTFNAVGIESFPAVEKLAFSAALAMPRPRNVLIPSIMTALWLGYRKIYLCGADHSWMRDLSVDDDNCVRSGMSHFYKESDKEIKRSANEYRSYRLHDIIYSYYIAFRSYHQISRYAESIGADILNATPGSFIDAFRRAELPFGS